MKISNILRSDNTPFLVIRAIVNITTTALFLYTADKALDIPLGTKAHTAMSLYGVLLVAYVIYITIIPFFDTYYPDEEKSQ